jgi:signal peptidase I
MNSTSFANTGAERSLFPPFRLSLRVVAALGLAAAGLMFGGCTTYSPAGNMDLFVRTAPVPSLVRHGAELAAAETQAAQNPGDFALIGAGSSMEPMYLAGTAIVVHPQSYVTLRKGQPVVYRNTRGYYVAHMLVEETRDGWIVVGVNNAEPDEELVTQNNLVGVIKAAYAAADTPFRADVAARIALKDGLDRGAKMALLR